MTDYYEAKINTFEKTLKTFKEGLIINPSELERDGAIQRFEYCYDLAWKTLKHYMEKWGMMDINSPWSVFTAAFAEGVIIDEATCTTIILKRNASVHTYKLELARMLFSELPLYYDAMYQLLQKIKE